MSNIIVVETFYFDDVPWLLPNQAITILLWFFLPFPFMAPFEATYNLKIIPNIPLLLLGDLVPTHPAKCKSSSMHFTIFIISWQVLGTSFLWLIDLWTQGCKPWRKATFWSYFSFMGMKFKRVWKTTHIFPKLLTHLLSASWTTFVWFHFFYVNVRWPW